jgi:hypothetical protein
MATKTYLHYAAATGLAAALSLAVVTSSDAARHRARDSSAAAASSYSGLYNYYAPDQSAGAGPNYGSALGPPDPASCGGFRC